MALASVECCNFVQYISRVEESVELSKQDIKTIKEALEEYQARMESWNQTDSVRKKKKAITALLDQISTDGKTGFYTSIS